MVNYHGGDFLKAKLKIAKDYILSHKDDIIKDLSEICSIPSVAGTPTPDAPFGNEVKNALTKVHSMYEEEGIKSTLYPEYVMAEFGESEKTLGIFSHADVVPAEGEWTLTDPFTPKLFGDFLVCRGAEDNKSGIIASLYAVKAIREAGIPLKRKLILVTGGQEETGMLDMEAFKKRHPMPDTSLIPDNEFPICYGEKGILHFDITSKNKCESLLSIKASAAYNIVPDRAVATFSLSDNLLASMEKETNENITINVADGKIEVTATGISSHAAYPDNGKNAIFALFTFLSKVKAFSENDLAIFSSGALFASKNHGESFNVAKVDPVFGQVSLVSSVARVNDGYLTLGYDCRYGTVLTLDEVKSGICEVAEKHGFSITHADGSDGFENGINNPDLLAFKKAYEEVTLEIKEPYTSCGGTYARTLKNAYSMGTHTYSGKLPEMFLEGHGYAHQKDETIHIPSLLEGIIILIHMIAGLE